MPRQKWTKAARSNDEGCGSETKGNGERAGRADVPIGGFIIMVGMLALRYLYVLALTTWLGGMVVLGAISAPATFEVLQERDPAGGRAAAGAVFGETLRRFHRLAYAAGTLMLGTLLVGAALGSRPRQPGLRAAIVSAMLAIALYSGFGISRRIERLQQEFAGPVSSLDPGDPRRAQFGRLHGLSTTLMLVNIVGGLVLLYWEAIE